MVMERGRKSKTPGRYANMHIGRKIRELRERFRWTQDELGERVSIHGRHISRYENGHAKPSRRTMERMAEAFSVPVEVLLDDKAPIPVVTGGNVSNPELAARFEDLSQLSAKDRETALTVIDALIVRHKMKAAVGL